MSWMPFGLGGQPPPANQPTQFDPAGLGQSVGMPTPGLDYVDPYNRWNQAFGGRMPNSQVANAQNAANLATGWVGGTNLPFSLAPKGIIAYHGSPHDFDRFDMSKIGTGEGAQTFGHGLYFAGNEPTAAFYRDSVTTRAPDMFSIHGDRVPDTELVPRLAQNANMPTSYAARTMLRDLASGRTFDEMRASSPNKDYWQRGIDWLQSAQATALPRPAGRMYEARLNVDPNALLDWDKPLSSQPASQVLARAGYDLSYNPATAAYGRERTGGEFLKAGLNDRQGADALRQAGIPGIQYLDAGSRTAGEGSRNYVMFDPSVIEILRKYGLAGMTAGGGAALPFSLAPQQQ